MVGTRATRATRASTASSRSSYWAFAKSSTLRIWACPLIVIVVNATAMLALGQGKSGLRGI